MRPIFPIVQPKWSLPRSSSQVGANWTQPAPAPLTMPNRGTGVKGRYFLPLSPATTLPLRSPRRDDCTEAVPLPYRTIRVLRGSTGGRTASWWHVIPRKYWPRLPLAPAMAAALCNLSFGTRLGPAGEQLPTGHFAYPVSRRCMLWAMPAIECKRCSNSSYLSGSMGRIVRKTR